MSSDSEPEFASMTVRYIHTDEITTAPQMMARMLGISMEELEKRKCGPRGTGPSSTTQAGTSSQTDAAAPVPQADPTTQATSTPQAISSAPQTASTPQAGTSRKRGRRVSAKDTAPVSVSTRGRHRRTRGAASGTAASSSRPRARQERPPTEYFPYDDEYRDGAFDGMSNEDAYYGLQAVLHG